MKYELNEIGEILVSSQFDEELYTDYLEENGLTDNPKTREEYIRDCFYDVEFFDSETYHHLGYEQMTIDEIASEFGEGMAADIYRDCLDGNEHRYEPLAYMNDEVNINSPRELADSAMKYLRHGEYFKGCRGFILTNGIVVYTEAEHSMCTMIPGILNTSQFIELGNIRIMPHSVDMAKAPTWKQQEILEEFFSSYYGEEVYLDLYMTRNSHVSIKYTSCSAGQAMNDIENYFSGNIKQRYIVRENRIMRINKNDLRHAISESIKGFRPHFQQSAPASQPRAEKVYSTGNNGSAQSSKPSQPVDYDKVELADDPKIPRGKEWAKTEGNFPIKRNGKIYYVSKSATASLAALCFDKKRGVWCILANQRGPGAGGKQGLWNLPVGYVERTESAEAAAVRETFEETGVKIPKDTKLRKLGSNSGYSDKISFAFSCVLEGDISDYPVSDENCEPGEVSDIKWIPVFTAGGSELKQVVSSYRWDRDPEETLNRAYTALLPYLKSNYKQEDLIEKLKSEIRDNPTALYLLDKIISQYQIPATK